MAKMLSVASGFQYSVNIGYDLNSNEKLKNFIPTKSALELLEEIVLSTQPTSTDRARVLIGAYGKGKSHIILMILSILMKRDLALFEKMLPKIAENPRLEQIIKNYYDSDNKILPVIISGSNTSLTQAFLLALQRTLSDNDLMDIMPDTNYKAAITVIERWKAEFPETYQKLEQSLDMPVDSLVENLRNYNISAYEQFEAIYPTLTAGSTFNPFLGFDIAELYESVAVGLKKHGYTGIYTVYDEFSKFLEANITEASVSDTKMLQDFAEKCNRSGKLQMHLMLISHKEISNYIDKLPQQKVDGWRGVSERFKHIHLNNNFSQTYEIVSSVIQKDDEKWAAFTDEHARDFESLDFRYAKHLVFAGNPFEIETAIFGCYPLHPISTFILPRLSERVAQNERTLFTFLSADGNSTLSHYLRTNDESKFGLITPDLIYDYFEPLFMKEAYASDIHKTYVLTSNILSQIADNVLGCKIVKTISLIYILEQFEKLKPTKEEICGIFSTDYDVKDIESTIDDLVSKSYVIYLKRSNAFLRLKQTSGVDIKQTIADHIESQSGRVTVKSILNNANFDNYMYPSRYNDEHEMIRFFAFEFIDETEAADETDWNARVDALNADGVIFGIIPHAEASIATLKKVLLNASNDCTRAIFVLPKHYRAISDIVEEYSAVNYLKDKAADDPILFEEYEVIYEDLSEVILSFMSKYSHPEKYKSFYIYGGEIKDIRRKAALTEMMSGICDEIFGLTPVINNEAVNRDSITTVSSNSRNKIISALLRNDLESNLGLTGTGQEVSIMRSTLVRTGVLVDEAGMPRINLHPADQNISNMLSIIENFVLGARRQESVDFSELYDLLTGTEERIGLRKGLIPIYLSAVIHEYKQQLIIMDRFGPASLNADVIAQIEANPKGYKLSYIDWNPEKEEYIRQLSTIFDEFIIDAERRTNAYDYVANAMKRWFLGLPKYSKECKRAPDGKSINKRYLAMVKSLRQNGSSYELLFIDLPAAFGYTGDFNAGVSENIQSAKSFYDDLIKNLKKALCADVKGLFALPKNEKSFTKMSLSSTIKDWCESLDARVFEQLFPDGTDKCLNLMNSIGNDDDSFIFRLAKLCTDLRIEDWDDGTHDLFTQKLLQYKTTAESFVSEKKIETAKSTSEYQVTYVDDSGASVTKRFDKVEFSKRGKLLFNQINASLEAMGHSISEQEKRQILMEIIKKLC